MKDNKWKDYSTGEKIAVIVVNCLIILGPCGILLIPFVIFLVLNHYFKFTL